MPTRREERGTRGTAGKSREKQTYRETGDDDGRYDESYQDESYQDEDASESRASDDADGGDPGDDRPDDEDRGAERPRRTRAPDRKPAARPALSAARAAQAGLRHMADLTGREVAGVTSLQPEGRGWVVGVEVVEDRRIPSSTDVLALYEAKIGPDGELLAYDRKRRYSRGKGDIGETS